LSAGSVVFVFRKESGGIEVRMSQDDAASVVPPDQSSSSDSAPPPAEPAVAEEGAAETEQGGRTKREALSGPVRLLLPIALAAGIIYAMKFSAGMLNPILLALFLTMGASPALAWMRRKGMAPWLAVTVVGVVMVVAVLVFMLIMLSAVKQLDEKMPVYQENLEQMEANVTAWFAEKGIDISGLTSSTATLSPETAVNAVKSLLSSVVDIMGSIFWIILLLLFMVAEAYALPRRLTQDIKMNERASRSLANFSDTVKTFLFTKGWLSALVAVLVTFIYLIFGVDFAVVWGLLFFVLSFIPNIGFMLSVIPVFFITMLEFGFPRAAVVVILVIVINTIVDNYFSPKIMGKSVGLSTLTVFMSVFFWGWVLGGLGALMSVPLMLGVKLLFFDTFDSTRTIADLMGTPVRELGKRKEGKKGKGKAEAAAGD
jgi:AI-2 transport protein TqsA